MSLKPFRGVLRAVTRILLGWQDLAPVPSSPPLTCAFLGLYLLPGAWGLVPQDPCTAASSRSVHEPFMSHSWCALFPKLDAEGSSILVNPPPRPLQQG